MRSYFKASFIILFSLLYIQAVAQQTPLEYNNAIIGEQKKITGLMLEMADQFAQNIDKSEILRERLAKQCEESIQKLKSLPPYAGNSKFRDAGVNLFSFYRELSRIEFKEMIDILKKGAGIQSEDLKRLGDLEKSINQREKPLDKAFIKAQQSFAKKHKLVLES